MHTVNALLLSLIGLLAIIFNRFAVEETRRILPPWVWWMPGERFSRLILAGMFFVVFGVLMALGFMQ
jgi:hypothetical protein